MSIDLSARKLKKQFFSEEENNIGQRPRFIYRRKEYQEEIAKGNIKIFIFLIVIDITDNSLLKIIATMHSITRVCVYIYMLMHVYPI